jgi:hypothetical protein
MASGSRRTPVRRHVKTYFEYCQTNRGVGFHSQKQIFPPKVISGGVAIRSARDRPCGGLPGILAEAIKVGLEHSEPSGDAAGA